MSFSSWIKTRQKYNAGTFEVLQKKCRGETAYGRWLNFLLALGLLAIRTVKPVREWIKHPFNTLRARRLLREVLARASLPAAPGTVKALRSPRFLIVAVSTIPQCYRYRVRQKLDLFGHSGNAATFVDWQDGAAVVRELGLASDVIFYRLPGTREVLEWVAEAKRQGCRTYWECDDLVFDAKIYAQHPYLRSCSASERRGLMRGVQGHFDAMMACDELIASTVPLAEQMKRAVGASKPVHVIPNGVDDLLWTLRVRNHRPASVATPLIILYGSGTNSHQHDLEGVERALGRLLRERNDALLLLVGPLAVPKSVPADRVVVVPFVPQDQYYEVLGRCDVNLAPLPPSVFNDSKSNIKFLEASALGIPTIASPSRAYADDIVDGETGLLATSEEEWYGKLMQLCDSAELRMRIGMQARDYARSRFSLASLAKSHLEPFLQSGRKPSSVAAKRPRLLVVNIYFPPTSFGGATIVAQETARILAAVHGWDVVAFSGELLSGSAPQRLQRLEWEGITVFRLGIPPREEVEQDWNNPAVAGAFSKVLDAVQPDVVLFHCIQNMGTVLVRETENRGIPFAVMAHDAWWLCARQFRYRDELNSPCPQKGEITPTRCVECVGDETRCMGRFLELERALSSAARVVAPSQFLKQLYLRQPFSEERFVVHRNGVLKPTRERRRTVRPSSDHVVFGYVGGPSVQKGFELIGRVFAGVASEAWTLRVPDPNLKLGIPSRMREKFPRPRKFDVIAPFDGVTIDEFYDSIDVLLCPSLVEESFGLAAREALIRDVWVVAFDAGGLGEDIRNGENGFLIAAGNELAFQKAIEECLAMGAKFSDHKNLYRDEIATFERQAAELDVSLRSMMHQ
jgi:glycosyltransferase involved in cell wall biosynthesis